MTQSPLEDMDAVNREVRQLALVDRILGLQAEVANLKASSPASAEALQRELNALLASRTWRVGRAVLSPLLLLRRVVRRGTKRPTR
jgi:hypothetical protein